MSEMATAVKPLSETLKDFGFRNVVGTIEKVGKDDRQVCRANPNCCGHENGTMVVGDENGDPWIRAYDSPVLNTIRGEHALDHVGHLHDFLW